jgi:hypothetical protein
MLCTRQLLPIQVLPIPKPGYPINDGQYAALARAFRKWKQVKGYKQLMPDDAYVRWCEKVGVSRDQPMMYLCGCAVACISTQTGP